MEILFWIGRIILGGLILMKGINHFTHFSPLVAYTASRKVPLPQVAVIMTGLMLVLSGLSIIFWYQTLVGFILLAVFMFGVTIVMHNFWTKSGAERSVEYNSFISNMLLFGASLIFIVGS